MVLSFVFTVQTELSMVFVNLKPLVPGHVLVAPRRHVQHMKHLRADELSDVFSVANRIGSFLLHFYSAAGDSHTPGWVGTSALEAFVPATGLNIAVQDGKEAGQTVPVLLLILSCYIYQLQA